MEKYLLLTVLATLIFSQDQDSSGIKKPISMYELGFIDGMEQGKKASHAKYALSGCGAGLFGGCTFALLSHELLNFKEDENVNRIAIASATGSIVTGGLFLYSESKMKHLPGDTGINDSLYIAGFNDGYKKATKTHRTMDTIGGWLIGSAISIGTIYFVYGVLNAIAIR